MTVVIHRVNTVSGLIDVPRKFGVEIDIRAYGSKLVLAHEPYRDGDTLESYLDKYVHSLLVLNIKEGGIERDVMRQVNARGIKDYFLLDVEYPFIYWSTRRDKLRNIAVRYSEAEPIEFAEAHKGLVDWVWIDTNSKLPLDESIVKKLEGFKTCLVCPERWGRPGDIGPYIEKMIQLNFRPTAVMTAVKYAHEWEKYISSE